MRAGCVCDRINNVPERSSAMGYARCPRILNTNVMLWSGYGVGHLCGLNE